MNKGFKKFALGLTTAITICFGLTPVLAAGSITTNGTTSGEVIVNGEVVEGSTSKFADEFTYLTESEDEASKNAVAAIEKLNEGTKLSEALFGESVKLPEGTDLDLKEFSLLTKVQDLTAYDKDGNLLEEDVTVTWEVPNLTKEAGDVYVLHFSTVEKAWEVIEPENVDYDKKEITAHFDDLSPVSVIYKSSESAVVDTENPNTSTSTNAGLYLGIGAVALVAIGAIVFKKHKA